MKQNLNNKTTQPFDQSTDPNNPGIDRPGEILICSSRKHDKACNFDQTYPHGSSKKAHKIHIFLKLLIKIFPTILGTPELVNHTLSKNQKFNFSRLNFMNFCEFFYDFLIIFSRNFV